MLNQKVLDEISIKINDLITQSPVKDVEKNLRVLLAGVFARLDLVGREEFDIQQEVLRRTREQLTALEERLTALETAGEKKKSKNKLIVDTQ
ncbi:MAG: hypothetical protein RL610_837 [Pseudomonadota bacterium]